ncbi:MAG: alpha-galactosidase [Alistipes sp.]|nr:alpha-galactosidase [Alistipes sp.]
MRNRRFWLCLMLLSSGLMLRGADPQWIRVGTDSTDLILRVAENGRLYQSYLGARLPERDYAHLPQGAEAYVPHGMEDYFEPAIRVLHNDGDPSLLLKYREHQVRQVDDNVTETTVVLADEVYPVTVTLHYMAFQRENVLKCSSEITHTEKRPVVLYQYASSMLHFSRDHYWLTEFSGEWATEVNRAEQPLYFGKKVLDTKLGTRAGIFCSPFFLLGLDRPVQENQGDALIGTIGWTGNFRFTFEVDQFNNLRLSAGINPYGSEYTLRSGEVFRTPEFIFCYSTHGVGEASRNLHRWARRYQVKDGEKERMTLLNNWEATGFGFNEEQLIGLLDEAQKLGVDMFLLDDGWFANKYPRNSDTQGLGDWQENREKLPHGLQPVIDAATKRGLKFGLWIEPEMVSHQSELYEKHPDWVIRFPNREEYYYRHQMVLDLSNPKVQDYVFGVVDDLKSRYPQIAYFKWDCNSPITNIYSTYLKEQQSHLYIDYMRGLYRMLDRIQAKYPDLPMMLCSGGGARCDYEALRYFPEFWASDNTEPLERIFIQWGFSYLFPSKCVAAHVTSWGRQSLKFKTDVAFMGRLGYDIRVSGMSEQELAFSQEAIRTYKRLMPVILEGDLYRLVSPYDGNRDHAAMMYTEPDRAHAVVFAFDMTPRWGEYLSLRSVRLQGLDPARNYRITELNRMEGASTVGCDGQVYSGDYLMKVGLPLFSTGTYVSHVLELTVEP